jgi:hypothetical protein
MKKILTLLCLFISVGVNAQIFWTENFESGTTGGIGGTTTVASSYTGPNGPWSLTVTSTGTEGAFRNEWYVSCAENGHTSGVCGTGCVASSTTATLATLHVGATFPLPDLGAAYYDGAGSETDRRAESPTINCTGRYTITVAFYYIEAGDLTNDNATVWYYDGTTWSLLVDPPKTAPICPGGQGMWTRYTYALPVSANNNPNVKLAFRWVNDAVTPADDPSFAVDSLSLSAASSTATPVPSYTVTPGLTACTGDCVFFDNTTTGAIDSLRWSWAGGLMAATDTMTMCFMAAGTFPITLTVYKSGTPYTTSRTVTVNATPAPITGSHTSCVGIPVTLSSTPAGGFWSSSNTAIATVGVTSGIVTGVAAGTVNITYSVMWCYAVHTFTVYPLPCTVGLPSGSVGVNELAIYPNPATNELFINMDDGAYAAYDITNEVGQSLAHGAISVWQTKVDVSSLPSGLYYIRLRGEHGSTVRKFVKVE